MPILLVVIVGFIAYFYFNAKTKHLEKAERDKLRRNWLLGGGLILLAFLAFTRGQVIIGAIASLVAIIMRGLPLLKFFPVFKGLFDNAKANSNVSSNNNSQTMTRTQAAEILGLKDDASEEEVIEAHKRLIQKMHPDKGGSEALAAQINLARKVMLGID